MLSHKNVIFNYFFKKFEFQNVYIFFFIYMYCIVEVEFAHTTCAGRSRLGQVSCNPTRNIAVRIKVLDSCGLL